MQARLASWATKRVGIESCNAGRGFHSSFCGAIKKGGLVRHAMQAMDITAALWCNKKGGQCEPSATLPTLFLDHAPD